MSGVYYPWWVYSHVGAGSGDEGGNGTYINWLYDFYPNVLGG